MKLAIKIQDDGQSHSAKNKGDWNILGWAVCRPPPLSWLFAREVHILCVRLNSSEKKAGGGTANWRQCPASRGWEDWPLWPILAQISSTTLLCYLQRKQGLFMRSQESTDSTDRAGGKYPILSKQRGWELDKPTEASLSLHSDFQEVGFSAPLEMAGSQLNGTTHSRYTNAEDRSLLGNPQRHSRMFSRRAPKMHLCVPGCTCDLDRPVRSG